MRRVSPCACDDDDAIAVLIEAAEHPHAFDHGFCEPFVPPACRLMYPAHLHARPSEALIDAVCERIPDFSRLLLAAVAAVDLRDAHRPRPRFGPYLRVAFPDGAPSSGEGTEEQRVFAHVIADRNELWNGTYHGVAEMFNAFALPAERDEWRRLAALPTGNTTYESVRVIVFETRGSATLPLDVPGRATYRSGPDRSAR